MTPEQRDHLRKPFDPKSIGKLPKGGAQLDFVGHAAVTDRLLAIDPDWSWEPFAVDERGLPQYDNAGGLWIRLTICGVTRLGYGDGPNPKERIGDALRNAAMRFGVALDLWSRQELEGIDPNGGDAAAPARADTMLHNMAQEAAAAASEPQEAPLSEWLEAFVAHLIAGPEDQSSKGRDQFYAKATAAAAKRRALTVEVTDQAGTTMTIKQLIEQEQLRSAA